jgi:hypothetical protein
MLMADGETYDPDEHLEQHRPERPPIDRVRVRQTLDHLGSLVQTKESDVRNGSGLRGGTKERTRYSAVPQKVVVVSLLMPPSGAQSRLSCSVIGTPDDCMNVGVTASASGPSSPVGS